MSQGAASQMKGSFRIPPVRYCARCVYPTASALPLTFDENGVCSGCRTHDLTRKINWQERREWLEDLVEPYRGKGAYDCIIPVSGGKDSYFQTHFVIHELGLKPLLVTYNGNNYLDVGWNNLMRMKKVFNTDHYIYSPGEDTLIRLNRLCFRKMGDMNWQNHAGIATLPMKLAALFNIPLVIWGEHTSLDLSGMYSLNDLVEFTARHRREYFLHGFDWYDMLGDAEDPVTERELWWAQYPSDSEISSAGVRGVYLGNYIPWDANAQTAAIIEKYGWEPNPVDFERTYRRISNLDDRYENGAHDYLKYIKFGYGRATDHACKDIRGGYMTRQQGIEMVRKYDHVKSSDIFYWLNYVSRTEDWFDRIADGFRDPRVWMRDDNGQWHKQNLWS